MVYFIILCSSWWRMNSYPTMNLDQSSRHQVRLKSKKPPKVKKLKANHVLCAWQNILMLSGILSEIIYLGMLHHRHVVHFVNFGQAHFLDLHNQKKSQQQLHFSTFGYFLDWFHVWSFVTHNSDSKIGKLWKLVQIYQQQWALWTCQGSVFSDEDSVVWEKFLYHNSLVKKYHWFHILLQMQLVYLHRKILSILINLSNSAELHTKVFQKYVVWILSSSFVYWSEKRATELGIKNFEFEFDKNVLEIFWKGVRGMKWESLIDIIEFCKSKFLNTDFIIIHLGSNNIKFSCSKRPFSEVQRDLNAAMNLRIFSESYFFFRNTF